MGLPRALTLARRPVGRRPFPQPDVVEAGRWGLATCPRCQEWTRTAVSSGDTAGCQVDAPSLWQGPGSLCGGHGSRSSPGPSFSRIASWSLPGSQPAAGLEGARTVSKPCPQPVSLPPPGVIKPREGLSCPCDPQPRPCPLVPTPCSLSPSLPALSPPSWSCSSRRHHPQSWEHTGPGPRPTTWGTKSFPLCT